MPIRLCPFLVGLASVLAALPLQSAEPLKAGADATDISPKERPLPMRGSFSPRAAESVHDPLHARTLVLDDGEVRISITVVDSLSVGAVTVGGAKIDLASPPKGLAFRSHLGILAAESIQGKVIHRSGAIVWAPRRGLTPMCVTCLHPWAVSAGFFSVPDATPRPIRRLKTS